MWVDIFEPGVVLIASIRTFVASIFVPGWGYWIVGRRKQGLIAAALMIASILVFSWTRLVLDPIGFRVLLACVLTILVGGAFHSAVIEFLDKDISRNWKHAFLFAGAYFAVAVLLFANRAATLGYETFRMPAGSMTPTLLRGDYMVVDTWLFDEEDPANGDIVVFELPDSGIKYIKRVAGVPGDAVSLLSNQLTRNGQVVDEPYAVYIGPSLGLHALVEETVPLGHYLLLGDNRNNSRDSRHFGMIPRDKVIGKISHIYYSSDEETGTRWDRIPTEFD